MREAARLVSVGGMIKAIAHPTDFSPESMSAFAHALRLAVATKSRLDLLHVSGPGRGRWQQFPQVRKLLEQWGLLPEGADTGDVLELTGVAVRKVEVADEDAVDGLTGFLDKHCPDLVVMASHGRAGLDRLVKGSVSVDVTQSLGLPALLVGPRARPFVNLETGVMALEKILVPVARDPDPAKALTTLDALNASLGAELDYLHVGEAPPAVTGVSVRTTGGPVVDAILTEASRAQMIAMPTAGRNGLLDHLFGSTTERVLAEANVPLLALPV